MTVPLVFTIPYAYTVINTIDLSFTEECCKMCCSKDLINYFGPIHIKHAICHNCVYRRPGGCLNKKDGLTRYGDSHVKDKTS